MTRQAGDIGLLRLDGCLDKVLLPFTMAAHKLGVAQSSIQVRITSCHKALLVVYIFEMMFGLG